MLFEVKKIADSPPINTGSGVVEQSENRFSAKLQEVINQVDHGRSVHWVSRGDWSMHQLLQALLLKTGPADVWISSYAFSELPARTVCDLKAAGVIKKLVCIIDSRVDVRSASALAMLRNAADSLKLLDTHAKVTVIKNEEWFLVVAGSANYTTNKRFEAGFICGEASVCSFHKSWIEKANDDVE